MKNLILIDTSLLYANDTLKYSLDLLDNSKSAFEILLEKLKNLELEKVVFLPLTDNSPVIDKIKTIAQKYDVNIVKSKIEIKNTKDLLKALFLLWDDYKYKNLILFYADSPFIDLNETEKLLNLHFEGLAEYTFGDNYAEGIVPEILSYSFIEKIKEYNYKKPDVLSRKIFDCMDADINKFFIEVEIAEKDFSLKRFELTASSKRNIQLLKNLKKYLDWNSNYLEIFNTIEAHPEILHIFPKYIEIEITNECNLNCIFCPRQFMKRKVEHMHFETFKKIINQLTSDYDDIILCFTLMGEPLLHPFFLDFVDYALNSKIFNLIIETNGILLTKEIISKLSEYPIDKLTILFGVDALKPETYSKLRVAQNNKNHFEIVVNNIKNFLDYNPENKLRTFIQIIKMEENKFELEEFYRYWSKIVPNIVIQKYNTYVKLLPEREIADLTPLNRMACWHLNRDLEIFVNGDVPLCKQDINGNYIIGNLNKDSIYEIWDKIKDYYIENAKFNYDKLKICSDCDEWWTFNF